MFLKEIKLNKGIWEEDNQFPCNLVFLKYFKNNSLKINKKVSFFIGENGTGKTTLIEALAFNLGLNKFGGSKNFILNEKHKPVLSTYLELIKTNEEIKDAFFFRAENFFNLQEELDVEYSPLGTSKLYSDYTGSNKTFREMSHGQGFKAFFENRIRTGGIYIFDEPESALSISSQIEFLFLLKELIKLNNQIIIITHSPIILSFPESQIFEISDTINEIEYDESFPYNETKNFLNYYKRFQKELIEK